MTPMRTTSPISDNNDSEPIYCPITGEQCEGDLSYLCEDYGCARKGGLSPNSNEKY
jgi:hypothetical protein